MSAFVTGGPVEDRDDADAVLALTGERTIPGIPEENYWYRRHEVVYRRLAAEC